MDELVIKEVGMEDVNAITSMNERQDFQLTDVTNSIVDRVVYKGNQAVAYGIVKYFAEAIFLVEPDSPLITRARAMRELMKIAIFGAKAAGCQQLHVFVKDPKLAESLKKQFGFVETRDIVLVRNI